MTTQTTETFAEIGIPTNPFPGLRPFEFDESHLFFGRDGQSEQLIGKLGRTRFLAVVGTSGSGKSSLVRAGLLPSLLGGFMTSAGSDWRVAIMRPGNDPIGNLARALNAPDVFGSDIEENAALQTALAEATLRRGSLGLVDAVHQAVMPDNENLLVVVDQFEEIFRFARVVESEEYKNESAAFIKLILEASRQREVPIYVGLTMRSDYLGDCSQFWDLPEAVNESQYLIPRLTRDQLREAINGPVAVGGGKIAPRLVNRLLNDVGDDQDQLPVLQHLLMRVWDESKEKRLDVVVNDQGRPVRKPHKEVHEGEAIDLCCYEAVGGMTEALSRHADDAFKELPDERHREVAEKLFKALTEKGPDNREIRRPITLGEICAITGAMAAEVVTIIESFRQPGRSFLMPPANVELNSESLIDISHESLIRGWARLKDWVDEEARSARTYQRLADTAELYRKGEEGFLRDPGLQLALDWEEQNQPNRVWARRYDPDFEGATTFLEESRAARDAEARQKQAQRRREIKRARITASVFGVLFLLALGALIFAFTKAAEARAALSEVRRQSEEATQQRNIAVLESAKAFRSEEGARKAGQEALAQKSNAERQGQLAVEQRRKAEKSALQAEEQTQIAKTETRKAELAKGQVEKALQMEKESERHVRQLNYVANMNLAQKAVENENFAWANEILDTSLSSTNQGFEWRYLWRLSHLELTTFGEGGPSFNSVAFSPDGKILAAGNDDGTLRLWSLVTGQELPALTAHSGFVLAVTFSHDGTMVATGGGDNQIRLWNTKTWKELEILKGHVGPVESVEFSPDDKRLATGSRDKTARLWDVATRREIFSERRTDWVTSVRFSPDGKTLATGSRDTRVKLWDVTTGHELATLNVDTSVFTVAFSPDGKVLATGNRDNTIKLWDVATGQLSMPTLKAHTNVVWSLTFSPDGKMLASASLDGTVKLWDTATLRESATLWGHTNYVLSVAFSSDSKRLATASFDGTVKLWDPATRRDPIILETDSSSPNSVAFSPDGRTIASGTNDGVKLWDTATQRILKTLETKSNAINSVAFSPNGEMLAAGGTDNTITLWDTRSWQQLRSLNRHAKSVTSIAFFSDKRGMVLASGSKDGTVKLWDIRSGEVIAELSGGGGPVYSVAFSPDGNTLAIGDDSPALDLWDELGDRSKWEKRRSPKGEEHLFFINSVAFSPDGSLVASGSEDGTVKLWSLGRGTLAGTFKGHFSPINSVAFSPDGKTLASGSNDKTVKLWDVDSMREVATLKGHSKSVSSLAFSPDKHRMVLASGSADKMVRLWFAATDEEIAAQRRK